jgi:hypothetical protein
MKKVGAWLVIALLAVAGFCGGLRLRDAFEVSQAHAAATPLFLATTFTGVSSVTSTSIQGIPTGQPNRHYIQIQNSAKSTGTVYFCVNTNNTCTAGTAAFELTPGQPFYATIGMYTGIPASALGNSGIFSGDFSMISDTGTNNVHVLIE